MLSSMRHSLTVRKPGNLRRGGLNSALLTALLVLGIVACGNKGGLYLPESEAAATDAPARQTPAAENDQDEDEEDQAGG